MRQLALDVGDARRAIRPFKMQLLKWVGNKQRFAHEIVSYFPERRRAYHEPFLGSGAVLGTLAPEVGYGSDVFKPLVDIWKMLRADPETLKTWYRDRWDRMKFGDKVTVYEEIKASYNAEPNAADFLFLTRSCYGGVVRFRQEDGYMSTPCGPHNPVTPNSFEHRVEVWAKRVSGTTFTHCDFEEAMSRTQPGDIVYCDPPYSDTQSILYGAQAFQLRRLFNAISECKDRGVSVLLSIDGTKKSGQRNIDFKLPDGLFEREAFVDCGVSQLRRFQRGGERLNDELVSDRLLLTF